MSIYTNIFSLSWSFERSSQPTNTHLSSHLHTELCICLLNIAIEQIKLQLCPSIVVSLSHKHNECEKSNVSKEKLYKWSIQKQVRHDRIEQCWPSFYYRRFLLIIFKKANHHFYCLQSNQVKSLLWKGLMVSTGSSFSFYNLDFSFLSMVSLIFIGMRCASL